MSLAGRQRHYRQPGAQHPDPEEIAEWVVRFVGDDSRAGAILQITKSEGATYVE